MKTFTTREILEVAELFRSVPNDLRGIATGLMLGANIMQDKDSMPDMVNIAMTMQGEKSA